MSNVFLLTEVRFKNNGLDLIEVQDNGSGISPDNYENVGKCDITLLFLLEYEPQTHRLLRQLLNTIHPNYPHSMTSRDSIPSASAAKPCPLSVPSQTSILSRPKQTKLRAPTDSTSKPQGNSPRLRSWQDKKAQPHPWKEFSNGFQYGGANWKRILSGNTGRS